MLYDTVKDDIDLIVRPNGRFVVAISGDLVAEEIFYDALCLMDFFGRRMSFYFLRIAKNGIPKRVTCIAEIEEVPAHLIPVLVSQRLVDVIIVRKGVSFDDLRDGDFQNFMATCRDMS